MWIDHRFLSCVQFLGEQVERGFLAEGTAFFVSVTSDGLRFEYAITCRHVIEGFHPGDPDRDISLRISREGKPPKRIPTKKSEWVPHPDRYVDLCAYPFDSARWDEDGDFDLGILQMETVVWRPELRPYGLNLSPGDQVFSVGAFTGRIGERRNIPIVRMGNIAALPVESVWPGSQRSPAYLLEMKSLGGLSGSPFFYNERPDDRWNPYSPPKTEGRPRKPSTFPYWLLGVIQGGHGGQYHGDFVSEDGNRVIPKDAEFNAGITVGLPVALLTELLEQPIMKQARAATVAAKRKDVGFRPTSASVKHLVPGTEVQAEPADTNPSHKEDFTALLGEAAQSRKQGG